MVVVAALGNLRLIWRDVSFLSEKKKAIIRPNCCCDFLIHHSGSLFLPARDSLLLQQQRRRSGAAGRKAVGAPDGHPLLPVTAAGPAGPAG